MTNTMPERTAAPLELAYETTRQLACGCGARPGYSCDGKGGMHLSRFVTAFTQRALTPGQMADVIAAAPVVFTAGSLIAGAR